MTKLSHLPLSFRAIALAVSLVATTAHSAPGDLYVSDNQNGVILRFSPDGTKSTFASGLNFPGGLAFDRAGNLFVSAGGDILKFTPAGTRSVFASDLNRLAALAFDGAGNLFVGCGAPESDDIDLIVKFTPAGEQSGFAGGRGSFDAFAFDTSANLFAALSPHGSGPRTIESFAPDGAMHVVQVSRGPGMAFDNAGNLYVSSEDFTQVLKYTRAGDETVFASGFSAVIYLALDHEGNLFAVDSGSIFKLAPDGTKSTFASGFDRFGGISIAFEPVVEKLRNISARGLVSNGDNVLIGGFIVGGSGLANNAVVIRAIGPSLADAGVTNPLADPLLEIYNSSGAEIASNNDWQTSQKDQIAATGLAPKDARESAIFATVPAGSYTAVVRSSDGATGQALVEIYNVTQ
jgi:hypothetical protein